MNHLLQSLSNIKDEGVFLPEVTQLLELYPWEAGECNTINGKTCLHICCERGFQVLALMLLSRYNVGVNARTHYGATALTLAVEYGHYEIVRLLLHEYKADVKIKDSYGKSAIFYACEKGRLDICELFSSVGSNFDSGGGGGDSSSSSCSNIDAKADMFDLEPDCFGSTPVHSACYSNHENVVKFLNKCNFPISVKNQAGKSPLYIAASKGCTSIVKFFLELSSIEMRYERDTNGLLPIHIACENGHIETGENLMHTNYSLKLYCQHLNPHGMAFLIC